LGCIALEAHGWQPVPGKEGLYEKNGVTVSLYEERSETNVRDELIGLEYGLHEAGPLLGGLAEGAAEAASWAGKHMNSGSARVRSVAASRLTVIGKSALNSELAKYLTKSLGLLTGVAGMALSESQYEAEGMTNREAWAKATFTLATTEVGAAAAGALGCSAGATTGWGDIVICPASAVAGGLLGTWAGENAADLAIGFLNAHFDGWDYVP